MFSLTLLIYLVVIMALLFDYVNGWNDSANAIATVVATRVLSPWTAVIVASVLNLAGALVGTEVANTVSKLINTAEIMKEVQQDELEETAVEAAAAGATEGPKKTSTSPSAADHKLHGQKIVLVVVFAGLMSAAIWAAVMTIFGMPISGSHSLMGGVIGAGVAAAGVKVLVAGNISKSLLAMLFAPTMGFFMSYFLYVALIWLTIRVRPSTMNVMFGKLQIFSASWMAFTHGQNDAQKVMGIITMALLAGGFQAASPDGKFQVLLWVQLACASAISIGTAAGGWKVMKTLGHHLTKLGPLEGFAAETGASLVLSVAAWLGVPTSTTHTITGSILGVGATRGMSSVRWGLGEKIMLAWVFTLPITAALGGSLYWLFSLLI